MSAATNSNESYCTFTLASDVTAGGLPSEEEIAKQLESNDPKVRNTTTRNNKKNPQDMCFLWQLVEADNNSMVVEM